MDRALEMEVFAKVVEEESFSAAARTLKLTPSAVSKQISRLEDRLGVRLLNRTTRHISVTDEGSDFYRRCVRILSDIDDAEQAVAQGNITPRGTLRLTCSIAFGQHEIVPLVPAFLEKHPEVRIELNMSDGYVDLVEEAIDLAIRIGKLPDSAHIARRIATSRRVIVAAPSYIERNGKPETPEDLLRHNCLTANVSRLNEWQVEGPEGPITARISGNFEVNSSDALYRATLAGLGIARLTTFLIAEDIRAGRLVPLLPFMTRSEVPIYAVYPHRRLLSPKVQAFVEFLVDRYSPRAPWEGCEAA